MKRITRSAPGWVTGLTLTALFAALALPGAAPAQELPKDMVQFKLMTTIKDDPAASYLLELDQPIYVFKSVGRGEAAPFGKVTATEQGLEQLGVDGKSLWAEVNGTWIGEGGDSVSFKYRVLPRLREAGFLITGGKGRFKDARGSGQMSFTVNEGTGEFTCTFEGFITAPR
jgi:hypothetical protein